MKRMMALVMTLACGDNTPPDPASCAGYVHPQLVAPGCGDPSDPMTLVACSTGSALTGSWAIDADGLPAYDFGVDERCDEAAHAYSPRKRPIRDPLHVVGDGRGTVAMAHASGGLDLYTQDRGHKWPVRIDTWADPDHPEFPAQLGAAIGYVVDGGDVHSTRFEDLPVDGALATQTRRFGVGYVETLTHTANLAITRRVFAMAGGAPDQHTLVTEITVHNASPVDREVGLVELDDINLYELPIELFTSDLLAPSFTTDIERRRRAIAGQFTHHASYDAASRVAAITTTAKAPTVGPDTPFEVDDFPETMWLAPLDDDKPEATWLIDSELWAGSDRSPPPGAAATGDASTRAVDFDGANQPGILAERIRVTVPAGGDVTRRFAFGVIDHAADPIAAAAAIRALSPSGAPAAQGWRARLVWAAFPGQPSAGALQRELAWSSYAAQALSTYDAYHETRLLGQGGSYKYIHGIDGAIGDYALFAEAMLPIDPELAADTLALSLATQRAPSLSDFARYPYATTGNGDFTDMIRYDLRSDAYFLMPSMVARYVALTRDDAYLDRDVEYWPRSAGSTGSVLQHLRATQGFADQTLGFGAHGIVAMGTNDYADGVLETATEPATPGGTSSTFNAWLLVGGFGLASDVVSSRDSTLAQRYAALRADQLAKLEQFAWNGSYYERGFVDSGNPLNHGTLYLEPQVLPIVAGAVTADRRAALLDLVAAHADTVIGPMTVTALDQTTQTSTVWPVASAWLTQAYALADPVRGWDSLTRNTLFAHAEAFPDLWYGVWSGPDSYYAPGAERPGEADATLATALTDYPVFNVHSHVSVLRALFAVAGVTGTAGGIAIAPQFPTETFSIVWPRLALVSTPRSIGGSITALSSTPYQLRVTLPSQLRAGTLTAVVDGVAAAVTRDGNDALLSISGAAGVPVRWQLSP